MSQTAPVWEELPQFVAIARDQIAKNPHLFDHIDPNLIIAYGVSNKQRPASRTKLYDMSVQKAPEVLTNTKKYIIKFFMSDWEARPSNTRCWIVCEILHRIDPENPDKIKPYDYAALQFMVGQLGPAWQDRTDLPDIADGRLPLQVDADIQGDPDKGS
jgi:hypothetical protein